MHYSTQYDLIKGQGHEPLKVEFPSIFKSYLLCIQNGSWLLTMDS